MSRGARGFEALLQATLANAVRAPFYRRRFGARWKKVRSLDQLALLPLLDKATAIRHQRGLVVGRSPPGFGISSSGTTRTDLDLPPLNVLTSPEEAEAIATEPAAPSVPDPHPGWTLVVVAMTHGLQAHPPGPGELLVPWMHDRNALYMMEAVLGRRQPDGRRVTAMRIGTGALKVLTAWLLERGKDPAAFGVRLIGTNSFRLTPFWRRLVEKRFGAELFDNYSLSEFATPATECKACGWLHFGWPPVLYEVLDLATGERKTRGVGRLVLTSVYPYVQKMPLIRYDTGDVVELGPRCAAENRRGVRFLGRAKRGLCVGSAFVLRPTAVQDVLEALPETERTMHPCATLGIVKSTDIGLPRWTVELAKATARLEFELRFDPRVYADRARDLENRVRAELLKEDADLRRLVRSGKLKLQVESARARELDAPTDKFA